MSTSLSNTACTHQSRHSSLWSLHLTYPDVYIFFGGGFKELKPETVSQLLPSLVGDDPLVPHVTLVAHQDDLGVVPAVGLDLRTPSQQIL